MQPVVPCVHVRAEGGCRRVDEGPGISHSEYSDKRFLPKTRIVDHDGDRRIPIDFNDSLRELLAVEYEKPFLPGHAPGNFLVAE